MDDAQVASLYGGACTWNQAYNINCGVNTPYRYCRLTACYLLAGTCQSTAGGNRQCSTDGSNLCGNVITTISTCFQSQ